jgi:hypothetical protein
MRRDRRRPVPLPALLALLALAACGSGTDEPERAGAPVSEGPRSTEGDAWSVETRPSLDLGGEEAGAAQQFGGVADAVRLSDGGVVVADALARELRWFAPDGTLRHRAGRRGRGPGEFTDVHRLFRLAGDTVAAWDAYEARLTRFDREGRLASMRTLRPLGDLPCDLVGLLPDGTAVMVPAFARRPGRGPAPARDTLPYLRVSPEGRLLDTLATAPAAAKATLRAGGGPRPMSLSMPLPFGEATHHAVHGDALYLADSGSGDVSAVGADGRRRMQARRSSDALPVTEADRRAERARLLGGDGGRPASAAARDLVERVPFPATKPAFAGMLVDADGAVWLREWTAPGTPAAWRVLDAAGRPLARVELPAGLEAIEIGRGHVLGTWTDALDVAHVRVHPLRRPTP